MINQNLKGIKHIIKIYIRIVPKNNAKKLAENFRRQSNYMCIEYWRVKYPEKTLEECEQLRQEFIKYNNSRIKNAVKPTNLEYTLIKVCQKMKVKRDFKKDKKNG